MICEEDLHPKVWELLYQLDAHTLLGLLLEVIESPQLSQSYYNNAILESMGSICKWDDERQKDIWSVPTLESIIKKFA